MGSFACLLSVLLVAVHLIYVKCDLNCIPVVLEGYDIVEYYHLEYNTCSSVMGISKYSYTMHSADEAGDKRMYQFWFSSKSNLQKFAADPWKYAPKFGGFCSFGVCCETGSDWPWEADHMGPPAGPDPNKCGFRVYNGSLYFNIDDSHDETFFADADTNLKYAEDRWISWYGSLHAGVFNWNCLSTHGWSYDQCYDDGQLKAPLTSSGVEASCGNDPNGQ
mmetsp:Transcript_19260/g.32238  ORF Transcript_19260/g.32238 Transcript_19260/m.32238 type:complete len:220 (-) Transcript_19260:1608-2267(-)|eukprot:CAMPEP_0174978810 /NCGR_PEP_ID=MMETSP0004_2-20121128/14418_1 /TAXON_ID=420556 /ORGANISM="Ochromonas sp., Strain CCMP1393" /LENGTH=219 /DNA_ID=CAMNT_0016230239 /DNA_START=80 /DNA_END=739 /DNA_ORIENTATION=+